MIELAINPVLVSFGPLAIRYYGLVYALGFLCTYFYLQFQIKHKRLRLTIDNLDTLFMYIIIALIIGARLGEFLFYQTNILFSDPLEVFRIWHGGMSFHGGALGVIIALLIFCKKYKIRFYELTDHLVIPASLALFFGRIANFINQELVGRITNVSWCMNFNGEINAQGEKVCRHPSQLYEALKNLGIFFLLLAHDRQQTFKRKYKEGYITWLFVLSYGVLRTLVNYWRDDVLWLWGIFGTGQFMSILMAIIALIVLFKFYWLKKDEIKPRTKTTTNKKKKVKKKGRGKRK